MEAARRRISFQCVRIALRLIVPPIMGASARYLILLLDRYELGVAKIADAPGEAEAKQMHEGEDVVREAGGVGVMFLDPQVRFMVKQPVEDIGGVAHANIAVLHRVSALQVSKVCCEAGPCVHFEKQVGDLDVRQGCCDLIDQPLRPPAAPTRRAA